ncbi:glycosyl transferase [Bradyrhizobium sp. CCBAU 65884]|uniref:glycosyltransferase n=1 Tax=Bradyrhizobium sp. CCBAU 65884 TaxID=722477 RepID=UPI0023056F18|nr:glycosyltransferase [Bradyrhizobium sp. CCBAU 65884]MDA9479223.1 glycosyl transferase [Bradyrhizobium sp. CCBAU 65884]
MRILHIIATADPRSGGPIEGIIRSSKALEKFGHFREVATLDHPDDPWVRDFPLRIFPLGSVPMEERRRRDRLPWIHYGFAPKLVPWLRRYAPDYDIVIVNGLWNYSSTGASRVLPGLSVPYFVFTHGMLDPWFRKEYPIKTAFKQLSWWFNEGPLLRNANGVLFTCEEERLLARNAFWPYRVREFVVGYGTSDVAGSPHIQVAAFRDGLPALGSRKFLLFLSRIHPKKGCDLLIDAFAKIASSAPDLDLVIAGPGHSDWVNRLKQQADSAGVADRIHWPGMLEGDQKWGGFHGCEAFVLPSHQENFGIVVAEALACAKPVLITDKVNIWREIKEDGAGLIAADDQAGVLSLLQGYLSLSLEERQSMAGNARETFLRRFNVEQSVVTLLDVFHKGISDGRP